MGSVIQHVSVAIRSLRRTPTFAMVVVLTLALGIGLSTSVFTVAHAVLIRRLPVAEQDRVVVLAGATRDGRIRNYPVGLDDAREIARSFRTLARTAAFAYEGAAAQTLRNDGGASRIRRALVTGEFFAVLAARPLMGRPLRPEDDLAGAAPVLVLSHRAWLERYGGATDVIGQRIVMHGDGRAYTIVGVMPRGLDFPRGTDAWATIRATTPEQSLQFVAVDVIGRLTRDATPASARSEMTSYFARPGHPAWQGDLRGEMHSLPELVVGDSRTAVLVFVVAAGLLLLITCVNVANLLLVRGLARAREIAVRVALGASRTRIVAQLLTEHAILALAGGIVGVTFTAFAVPAFVRFAPTTLPRLDEIALDLPSLLGAVGITALAMLVFGLAPALLTSRVELQQVLGSGSRQSAGWRSRRVTEGLVAGQIALALLVLSAAALIGRSFVALERADLSFEPTHLLVAELALRHDSFDSVEKQAALLEQLVPRLSALPGVVAVSPVVSTPFAPAAWDGSPAKEGQSAEQAARNPMLNMEVVTPSYFATFQLPVLRGRPFTDDDRQGAPAVVMLSASAARLYWPNESALGKRLSMEPGSAQMKFTVVGVVPDMRYRDLREARPSIYFPLRQSVFPFAPTTLAIRTSAAPTTIVPALRRMLAESAPGVQLASAAPFEELLAGPLAQPRLNALLLLVFAAAAVTLAGVGLFAVMATMVRQRTRELGVRMALGATTGNVLHLLIRRGLLLATTGIALGLFGALVGNRVLAAMLFEVSPTDATTLGAASLLLLAVATTASIVPARSATRIDPVVALRAE